MFQYYEWNAPDDGSLWRDLAARAPKLAAMGVSAVLLPPPYKGHAGVTDTGYGVYDLYDLGEFDQKGTVRTKYGTRDELLAAIKAVRGAGMNAYVDVVLNHHLGADDTEEVEVVRVNPDNRNEVISEPYVIRAWAQYRFEGRKGAYSSFQWRAKHFNAFGSDANHPEEQGQIYRVRTKTFSGEVDFEFGNFDYLMGANVDHYDDDVRAEMLRWGTWLLETTGADGVRIDAAKHVPASFYKVWLETMRAIDPTREMFAVGEYWSPSADALEAYLKRIGGGMNLFDAPLHFQLQRASMEGRNFDLRQIFDGSLVQRAPLIAVTFVDNHDTQPGQSLESWVGDWFKPLAYALILLRKEGYPCVFYGDYFGNAGNADGYNKLVSHQVLIDAMMVARARYLHGDQHDAFDEATCIGWSLTGNERHPGSLVVVMTTADAVTKRMQTFSPHAMFRDVTGHHGDETVTTREDGFADFPCLAGSVSVWCEVERADAPPAAAT